MPLSQHGQSGGGMSGPQFMVKDQKDAVTGIIPCNENQV
jgi:hypothetical protein